MAWVSVATLLGACSSSNNSGTPATSLASASSVSSGAEPATSSVAAESSTTTSSPDASSSPGSVATSSSPSSVATTSTQSSAPKSLGAADPGAASAGDPTQAAYTATGALIADDGFRPNVNGFAFQNYGQLPTGGTNMVPADVQKIFGDGVCADATSGKCDLIPEAQSWLDKTNAMMGGGHCYGFAVATQLLWQTAGLKPGDFGAGTTPALTVADNAALQRQIATNWAYQVLDSVNAARVKGTPNDIVTKLKASLVPNPTELYVVAIFNNTGGHAVTPYALEDAGNGIVNILVYDNNWPGVTRAIKVDTNANTWSYLAALNPNEKSELYQGDATTGNLLLYPTSPALTKQACPFCGKVQAAGASGLRKATVPVTTDTTGAPSTAAGAPAMDEIYLSGGDTEHGHLLITNPSGQRIGYVNGKVVNEIPGADVIAPMSDQSWLVSEEPEYHVPDGVTYTVTIDGTALTAADAETVGLIGPSYDLAVSAIDLHPGETDTLVAAPDATQLTYTASSAETPTFDLGVSDTQADYAFTISGETGQPGSTINVGLPREAGTLSIDTGSSSGTATLNLTMTREDDKGLLNFKHDGVTLAAGDSASLQFGSWSADGDPIPLVLNQGGTQTNQMLTDTPG